MKNKEKYYDEIMQNFYQNQYCNFIKEHRNTCDNNCNGHCFHDLKRWLEQEYKEPIKLTDDERVILRNVDKCFKWITRDKTGYLYLWEEKPHKKDVWWNDDYGDTFNFDIYSHLFQFVKWSDEAPYSIEELLND